jgi:hypothetical protein
MPSILISYYVRIIFYLGALYPLELIKTRMQVIDTKDQIYRHFVQSVRTVVREEGVRGLYQGMSPALFAASGSWGGYFYFYEKSKTRKLDSRHLTGDSMEALSSTDHVSCSSISEYLLLMINFYLQSVAIWYRSRSDSCIHVQSFLGYKDSLGIARCGDDTQHSQKVHWDDWYVIDIRFSR